MHYLYIIQSQEKQTYYVGETNNLDERLLKHNNHVYSKSFSKIASDWKFVLTKTLKNKDQAVFLEKFIKRMKSKKFLLKVINNPAILDDILSKRNN